MIADYLNATQAEIETILLLMSSGQASTGEIKETLNGINSLITAARNNAEQGVQDGNRILDPS